jgi:hypothetical protein
MVMNVTILSKSRWKERWALNVFNRWGNEVFNETDYKNDWDGGELSPGVYYYYLTNGCLSTPVSGTLSIVR